MRGIVLTEQGGADHGFLLAFVERGDDLIGAAGRLHLRQMRLYGFSAFGIEQFEEGAAGKAFGGLIQKLTGGGIALHHLQTIRIDDEDRLRGDLK